MPAQPGTDTDRLSSNIIAVNDDTVALVAASTPTALALAVKLDTVALVAANGPATGTIADDWYAPIFQP